MAFRRIMCPIDFSAGSAEALRVASELASAPDCSLVLVHVWQPSRFVSGDGFISPEVMQDMLDAEESQLATSKLEAQRLGAREVATKFLTGAPWDQIVNTARNDRAIDLIVIGTHGHTGIAHVLLGSVAEKVARHAPCPVLVVRAREKP
jgi:nucleotide-binding universal stress UspA family protein